MLQALRSFFASAQLAGPQSGQPRAPWEAPRLHHRVSPEESAFSTPRSSVYLVQVQAAVTLVPFDDNAAPTTTTTTTLLLLILMFVPVLFFWNHNPTSAGILIYILMGASLVVVVVVVPVRYCRKERASKWKGTRARSLFRLWIELFNRRVSKGKRNRFWKTIHCPRVVAGKFIIANIFGCAKAASYSLPKPVVRNCNYLRCIPVPGIFKTPPLFRVCC